MAKHDVSLKIDHEIVIGNVDIELAVKVNGEHLGRVKVSRGTINWLPTRRRTHYAMNWTEFGKLMEREGKPLGANVQPPNGRAKKVPPEVGS